MTFTRETQNNFFFRKETPIENDILCTPKDASTFAGYDSPPPSKRNLDQPPPLHRNKKYKKRVKEDHVTSSSSDDECDTDNKTYNLRRTTTCEGSQNVIKTESKIVQRDVRSLRKRTIDEEVTKSNHDEDDRSSSPMKRSKKMLDSINEISCASTSTGGCSSVNVNSSKPYSELKYLESIGSIRTIRRAKHPGINKVPSTKSITATPFVSPESQNGWDRKTKLKISYRTGLVQKEDIQFALIIYEPLTMVTRRNLLDEFERAAEEEKQEQQQHKDKAKKLLFTPPSNPSLESIGSPSDPLILKTPNIRNKTKNEKVSSLRRLRF